jgi:hypothetical protein
MRGEMRAIFRSASPLQTLYPGLNFQTTTKEISNGVCWKMSWLKCKTLRTEGAAIVYEAFSPGWARRGVPFSRDTQGASAAIGRFSGLRYS